MRQQREQARHTREHSGGVRLRRDKTIQEAAAGPIMEAGRALREHAALDLTKGAVEALEEEAKRAMEKKDEGRRGAALEDDDADVDDEAVLRQMEAEGAAVREGDREREGDGEGKGRQYEGYELQEGEEVVWAFEVGAKDVERVKERCLPEGLNFPMLEEYDFKNDRTNPTLPVDLGTWVRLRGHQEKCLSKMFGNGRARSGIVVLPCGAGKTLTGIAAATRIKKSTIILCKVRGWGGPVCRALLSVWRSCTLAAAACVQTSFRCSAAPEAGHA